jgi:predicted acylesterase/phospholipase RssA
MRSGRGWSPGYVLLTAALASGFASCAVIHRPPTSLSALDQDRAAWTVAHQALIDQWVTSLVHRAAVRGDRTLDLLLLSGGGQNGAYGAGFLRGWKSRPDASMPGFDLVTGVSAGAIQAPFAFLGTTTALDESSMLFRDAARAYAPTLDWWFWIRHTGGITNVSRYRAVVTRVINTELQRQLAPGFEADRHLVMSTTDFDLGLEHDWDLGHELGPNPAGLPRARQILLASSAIPSIFPPVILDGHVHADGGVISNLCVPLTFGAYQTLGRRLEEAGLSGVTVRLWVVLNLWSASPVHVTDPASRGQMRSRAGALLFTAEAAHLLQDLTDLTQAVNLLPSLHMEFRATTIPAGLSGEPGADKFFDGTWMRRLEEFGYDRARGSDPWDEAPRASPSAGR